MRIPKSFLPCGLLASALVVGLSASAHAALYGNFIGGTTTYENVDESDSQSSGPPVVNSTPTALFGAPAIVPAGSDNLTFPAISFSSLSADGQFEFEDGKLTFNMVPNSLATSINSLMFDEGGAWRVQGPTSDASSEATLIFNDVRITSVNGVALANPIVVDPQFSESIVIQTGAASTVSTAGDVTMNSTGSSAVGTWDITADFNLAAALAQNDLSGKITGVSVGLNNQLLTDTTQPDSGLSLAEIDKKHFIVSDVTTTVPEPASMSILLAAGLLLLSRSPRRLFSI